MLVRLEKGRNELREDRAKAPKLPSFVDGKGDLDAYLQRFERFAKGRRSQDGPRSLVLFLSGRTLEVCWRL